MTPCPPLGPVGPWKRPSLTMSVVSLKFHLFLSPVDSEKSLSPLVDETQPFTVPFRPYAWSSYPGPGLRPLVPQSLHPGVEVDRGPAALAFYGDRSSATRPCIQSVLWARRPTVTTGGTPRRCCFLRGGCTPRATG